MTVKVKQTILIIVELITAYLIGAAFVASFCALILSRWGGVGHNRPLAQIAVVIVIILGSVGISYPLTKLLNKIPAALTKPKNPNCPN